MSHLKDSRREGIITASRAWSAIYERQDYWRELTLRKPPFEGNEMTQYGNDCEHIALSAFEWHMNDFCESGNHFIPHPSKPFGASPDAFYEGLPVELKCPFSQKVYEEIPERYYFQVQMQLEVCDKSAGYFYCWTPEEQKLWIVDRDTDFWNWYEPLALEFLNYVKTDTEPKRWSRKPVYLKEAA